MHHATTFAFAALLCCHTAGGTPGSSPGEHMNAAGPGTPRAVTVPITLDHNRMLLDVELLRRDGTVRESRAWVDTGNQYMVMSHVLARDLGFAVPEPTAGGRPVELEEPAPAMRVGGLSLRVEGVTAQVLHGARVLPGIPAEVILPASVLRHYHVVFDYPAKRLTIAPPGNLEPVGKEIACRVSAETGLFMVDAVIAGDTVSLGVDNGSAGTWFSNDLTRVWRERHADWPHAIGAAGSANFFGFPFECDGVLMRLPELRLGDLVASGVALLGLDQGMFDWYSRKSAGPVRGFIGANVLVAFRLEIDFANEMTYWSGDGEVDAGDLDIVGLTLRPRADGGFSVASVVTRDGEPVVAGVEPGDKLVRVDGLGTADATMGTVVEALRGKPGSRHTLVIERDGKRLSLEAMVTRLP